jgi:hypothetical protein
MTSPSVGFSFAVSDEDAAGSLILLLDAADQNAVL